MGDQKIYRSTDSKGRTTYGDRPPMPEPGTETYVYDHRAVEKAIKIVRRNVPKWPEYLDYLDTLRHYNSYQFERALRTLSTLDAETYRKVLYALQRTPCVHEALGHAVTDGMLGTRRRLPPGAVVRGAREGKILRQWLSGTVHHMMKRSNSSAEQRKQALQLEALHKERHSFQGAVRHGVSSPPPRDIGKDILKKEAELNSATSKMRHAQNIRAAEKSLRAGQTAPISRLASIVLDIEMKLLNPATWMDAHDTTVFVKINQLHRDKIITSMARDQLYAEMRDSNGGARVVAQVLLLLGEDLKQRRGTSSEISDVSDYVQKITGHPARTLE